MWNNGDYIFKPGYYSEYCTLDIFSKWEKTIEFEDTGRDVPTVQTAHVMHDILDRDRQLLINLANNKFNADITEFCGAISAITPGVGIGVHTDHWDTTKHIPVRGLIYLNPVKVFGTRLHNTDTFVPDDYCEVGGSPGDLFIFKTSDTSWHSVGHEQAHSTRFTLNLLFFNNR